MTLSVPEKRRSPDYRVVGAELASHVRMKDSAQQKIWHDIFRR